MEVPKLFHDHKLFHDRKLFHDHKLFHNHRLFHDHKLFHDLLFNRKVPFDIFIKSMKQSGNYAVSIDWWVYMLFQFLIL